MVAALLMCCAVLSIACSLLEVAAPWQGRCLHSFVLLLQSHCSVAVEWRAALLTKRIAGPPQALCPPHLGLRESCNFERGLEIVPRQTQDVLAKSLHRVRDISFWTVVFFLENPKCLWEAVLPRCTKNLSTKPALVVRCYYCFRNLETVT